ncbi:MAG: DNA methyltransferase [Gammaproteobacteria bacterium]
MDNSEEYRLLEYLCRDISQKSPKPQPMPLCRCLDVVLEHCETSRGVLAVLMTLLLKKALAPQQDIRLHQAGMEGGFAGRGMDARTVTPFLKRNKFPAMQSGSGWLTRSLEQAAPYNMDYPGKIRPVVLKAAFLQAINEVQVNGACPKDAILYILAGLVRWRDMSSSIRLSRPNNLTIAQIVRRLRCHFDSGMRGAARLPVLAVYAAYQRLVLEMERYKDCQLPPLESHTAADQKTGSLGDVQVMDKQHLPMEAVEIKHGVRITPGLARDCYAKFRTTSVKTFYLLSTDSTLSDASEIEAIIDQIRREHGCQLIVNGILETLAYYLRLMKDTSAFVNAYVKCVEDDAAVNYDLKMAWESARGDKDDS